MFCVEILMLVARQSCFGYIACHCICFAIIVFYWSEIFSSIFTHSGTMLTVLDILR
jgi:hypothetical protein